MLYIYAEVEIFAFLSLSVFTFSRKRRWSNYSKGLVYNVVKNGKNLHFADVFVFSHKVTTPIHQTRGHFSYFSPKLCPLFLSYHHQRERDGETETDSLPRARRRKDTSLLFSHRTRALPEKEVLSVCLFFLSLLLHQKSIKRTPQSGLFFPRPLSPAQCSRKQRSWSELFYARKPGR